MNHDSLIATLCNACWVLFANAKNYLIGLRDLDGTSGCQTASAAVETFGHLPAPQTVCQLRRDCAVSSCGRNIRNATASDSLSYGCLERELWRPFLLSPPLPLNPRCLFLFHAAATTCRHVLLGSGRPTLACMNHALTRLGTYILGANEEKCQIC